MSGLFKRKLRQNPDEKKPNATQQSDGSDSPRPFLLTSGCHSGRNPLDWSAMPSTLQNQFPHWKETSVPSPIISSRSPDRGLIPRPVSESVLKKFGGDGPEDSIPYFVMEKDTLVSIALKFDTTTNEIARINKRPLLASFPIYPGELLYIPDSDTGSYAVLSPPATSPCSNDEPPGDVPPEDEEDKGDVFDRQEEFLTKGRSSSLIEMEDEVSDTHVYVSSKFMSDQLCVHGYLVINTQSIMFKPNEEDPLVEDNGSMPYEIWLPIQEIVYCYITRDYSFPSSHTPSSIQSPPPTVAHAPSNNDPAPSNNDHAPSSDDHDNETGGSNRKDDVETEDHTVGVSVGVASESPELTLTNHTIVDNHDDETTPSQGGVAKRNNSGERDDMETGGFMIGSESNNSNNEGTEIKTEFEETRHQSVDKNEHESSLPGQPQLSANQNEVFLHGQNRPVANRTLERDGNHDNLFEPPAFERSDTLNSLFHESYEKSISESSEDVPPSAPSPWFFLYCRLSQSSQQSNAVSVVGMKIPCGGGGGEQPVVQTVRTWFIFAIPKRRVEDIYRFLCSHHPLLRQQEATNESSLSSRMINGRLEIINIKGSYSDDSLLVSESHFLEPASSWEIFSVRDIQPPHIESMNVEGKLPLPHLIEPSHLLNDTQIRKLMPHLVSGAVSHDWQPVYTTFSHGFSLHTLYRNMIPFQNSPVLLVIQDSYGKVFGVMVPCPLRVSDRFYGTGESFLFTFNGDDLYVFPWIGENDYVIKGSPDSIAFGSGDGFFGLWLDENLYRGSSHTCITYNNQPLATAEDYIINGVEAWGFV